FGRNLLTHLGVEVDHDDLGTGGQETFGGGSAESGGSAGDERDCVLQVHGCPSLHLSERSVEATLTQACGTGHLPVHSRSACWMLLRLNVESDCRCEATATTGFAGERAGDRLADSGRARRSAGGPCSVCAQFGDPVGDHFML